MSVFKKALTALESIALKPTAQVIMRYSGLVHSERDILDSIGTWKVVTGHHLTVMRILTRMLAHAVLLVISVTKVETKAIRKLTSSGSRL